VDIFAIGVEKSEKQIPHPAYDAGIRDDRGDLVEIDEDIKTGSKDVDIDSAR
jgi:hypothetical protein